MKIKIHVLVAFCMALTACGSDSSAPSAPTAVSVATGATAGTAKVSFSAPASSGSSAITGYTVTASPGNITVTGMSSPITVTGLTPQTAYAFSVVATNSVGNSAVAATNPLSFYDVVETFYEPMTQPNDSIFTGTFTFDATSKTVSNLTGSLTESMTKNGNPPAFGPPMTTVSLVNQLSAVTDATLGGQLVTTFKNTDTNTFLVSPTAASGWTPADGVTVGGVYYGSPGTNPANAYAMIFVNTTDPTTALTPAQINKLAYADCTPGGMMMTTCMTGTSMMGYGGMGTMMGVPQSQVVTKR